MGKVVVWIMNKTNGWKAVAGYLLLTAPFITDNPMLKESVLAVFKDPSAVNISTLIAQAILAIGIIDRIKKNLTDRNIINKTVIDTLH